MCPPNFNQVERFGKPTWRTLVEAAEDKVGGNNPALAHTIAGDHPGAPGNHICCSLLPKRNTHNLCFWHNYTIAHGSGII